MSTILYLSHTGSSIGGGERQLYYLVTNLESARYRPIVACPTDGVFAESLRRANILTAVIPLPAWRKVKSLPFRRAAAARLTRFAKQHQTDLIHTSDSWLNPYLWHIKKQLLMPTISHVRTVIEPKRVPKYRFDKIDRIIAISEETKAPLVAGGIPSERVGVLYNCVDLAAFNPQLSERNILRKTFSLKDFIVGIVGRIEPFKQQKALIHVASNVIKRCPNVSFLFIGSALAQPEHRAYEQDCHQLIAELKLDEHVIFTGHRVDMPAVMAGLDVLVTASAGSVIAEAMAARKPVIATPIGSASEMVADGVSGFVVPLEQMAEVLCHLIQSPELCGQLGYAGRQRAEQLFSIDEHIRRSQAIYDELVS